jgi:alcohol dehydrogenase (cytochrome c)
VDAQFRGRPRKLLLQGNRNGFFYVLDRVTGEFLMAEPFVKRLTWASGMDGWRPKLLPGNEPTPEVSLSHGASLALHCVQPTTGFFDGRVLQHLHQNSSGGSRASRLWRRHAGALEPSQKYLRALDIQTGKVAWEIPVERHPANGLMSTAASCSTETEAVPLSPPTPKRSCSGTSIRVWVEGRPDELRDQRKAVCGVTAPGNYGVRPAT